MSPLPRTTCFLPEPARSFSVTKKMFPPFSEATTFCPVSASKPPGRREATRACSTDQSLDPRRIRSPVFKVLTRGWAAAGMEETVSVRRLRANSAQRLDFMARRSVGFEFPRCLGADSWPCWEAGSQCEGEVWSCVATLLPLASVVPRISSGPGKGASGGCFRLGAAFEKGCFLSSQRAWARTRSLQRRGRKQKAPPKVEAPSSP